MRKPELENKTNALGSLNISKRLESKYAITPENIPYFVHPIVEFIHNEKPDYIIALDSGARITGLAVFKLHGELYGPLPTFDHKLHFRRISHKVPRELVVNQIRQDMCKLLTLKELPKIMIVDDWVTTGRTIKVVRKIISELSENRAQVSFGVMREFITSIADVSGDRLSIARSTWHHQSSAIGIKYSETLNPEVLNSPKARALRQEVFDSISSFVAQYYLCNSTGDGPESSV